MHFLIYAKKDTDLYQGYFASLAWKNVARAGLSDYG